MNLASFPRERRVALSARRCFWRGLEAACWIGAGGYAAWLTVAEPFDAHWMSIMKAAL